MCIGVLQYQVLFWDYIFIEIIHRDIVENLAKDPKGIEDLAKDPKGREDLAKDPKGREDLAKDPEGSHEGCEDSSQCSCLLHKNIH